MMLLALAASNISLSFALLVGNRAAVVPISPRSSSSSSSTSRPAATFPPGVATSPSPSSSWSSPRGGLARSRRGRGHPASYSPPPSSSALSSSAAAPSAAAASASSSAEGAGRTAFATAALVSLDVGFRSLFAKYSIPFPSSLAGCGALFAVMLSLNAFAGDDGGGGAGEGLYRALNPGATLLAKWLPVFFVPSLIALPLASGIGNAWEVRARRSVS